MQERPSSNLRRRYRFSTVKTYFISKGSEIDELIEKNKSDQIVLNIVKCHFDAKEDDIRQAFEDFDFL